MKEKKEEEKERKKGEIVWSYILFPFKPGIFIGGGEARSEALFKIFKKKERKGEKGKSFLNLKQFRDRQKKILDLDPP